MTLGEKAVKDGLANLGVHEVPKGSNDGPFIRVYLAFVGIFHPAAWCCAYCSFRIHKAAASLGIKSRWPKSGYVQGVYNWSVKNTIISTKPLKNHAFVVYYPNLKRYAHIGLIADVKGDKFLTVEGNSNTDGGREGYAVVSQWRLWTKNHKSIRIV